MTSEPGPSRNGSRRTSGSIVVVEDDQANRTLLTRILESEGFAVLATGDALEAMANAGHVVEAPVDAFALLARRIRPKGLVSPFPARGG